MLMQLDSIFLSHDLSISSIQQHRKVSQIFPSDCMCVSVCVCMCVCTLCWCFSMQSTLQAFMVFVYQIPARYEPTSFVELRPNSCQALTKCVQNLKRICWAMHFLSCHLRKFCSKPQNGHQEWGSQKLCIRTEKLQ